jgi:hypothetical protein
MSVAMARTNLICLLIQFGCLKFFMSVSYVMIMLIIFEVFTSSKSLLPRSLYFLSVFAFIFYVLYVKATNL